MEGLTVGRIVHYSSGKVHRAAIVTKVISKQVGPVELHVFWTLDAIQKSTPRVSYSEDTDVPDTWHWIEKA